MRNTEVRSQKSGASDQRPVANSQWSLASGHWPLPRPRRAGVTIIEVLFSILITSVGLLGAIALFPVASAQANRAKQNDAVAAAGRAAFHTFDMMGMRRPADRWYYWNVNVTPARFDVVNWQQGISYCIDSRFVVRNTNNMPLSGTTQAQYFPYKSPANSPTAFMNRIAFFPGTVDNNAAAKNQFDRTNTTTGTDVSGGPAYGRNLLLADSIFQCEDDLSIIRPGLDDVSKLAPALGLTGISNDRSIPAFQIFPQLPNGSGGGTITGPRPNLGHISWMATLVPRVDLSSGYGSDQYVLSIVMFYDRPSDLYLTTGTSGNQNILERTVSSLPQDDGSTGGEFLLSVPDTAFTAAQAEARLKVKPNDWIMLSGTQSNTVGVSTYSAHRFQWYRVTHCDQDVTYTSGSPGTYSRYVTLMGQDWDVGSMPTPQATLMTGVVAVYEKTIRLDYGSTF